jgi:hypothetical protein
MESSNELRDFLGQFEIVTDEDVDIDFVVRRYCEKRAIDEWLEETGRVYDIDPDTDAYLRKNIDVYGETIFTGDSRTVKLSEEEYYELYEAV